MSNVDVSGIRHTVEVSADSLYETAVLAVRTFQQHDRAPGDMNALEVEIRSLLRNYLQHSTKTVFQHSFFGRSSTSVYPLFHFLRVSV